MYNYKFTKSFRNPGKMYIKMTSDDLNNFFSSSELELLKSKCKKAYTITEIKRGILEANNYAVIDEHIHTVDLLIALLGKYEDLEKIVNPVDKKEGN